ncbi:efflux RND transporter permease subunit [Halorhodospira halochloris]|uniref:efflux RND transporter permease subunit n=1 Tax=Halorhodospira halochloris TaxID=1052 RepID=UPI001EE94A52|nr:efflux RND transporter permease subunit [Halorhodospira halochloris]MCG5547966.1 efflux RND transporter permease subunit [Halorhodospira halochloris]
MPAPRRDAMRWLAEHPVAANLVLALMFVSGFYAVTQLNTQFFPNFELEVVTVEVPWTGATAEDVAASLTRPLEDAVRDVQGLREMESSSTDGLASITLEFAEGTDMTDAVESVKDRVAGIRNLPEEAEEPTIRRPPRFDPIARVAISGDVSAQTLRAWAQDMEDELLRRGVADVQISGMAELEAAVEIEQRWLLDSGLTFGELGNLLASESLDMPGGEVGAADIARQLRSLEQRRSVEGLRDLQVSVGDDGLPLLLGDLAQIELRAREQQVSVRRGELPAIEMLLQRAEDQDSLEAARILDEWYADVEQRLPDSMEITLYDQFWELVSERIGLLLVNGLAGLLLVVAILFTFLTARVAFWVTVGIPAAFLAALTVLWAVGGTINMMSLFALIMTLGIIVDDAIVVGERGVARFERGESPGEAAAGGARDMLAPVMASSLTTVAAFIPLMAIGGTMGNIMFDIPLVVICVIIASLIEAFIVLPGHLRRSFEGQQRGRSPTRLRRAVESGFDNFRYGVYRRWVSTAVRWRWSTLASACALLVAAIGLVAGGRIDFTFFPEPEGTVIYANVGFAPGTPPERVDAFIHDIERKLTEVDEQLAEQELVRSRVVRQGETYSAGGERVSRGDHYAGVVVELISPELREVRNSTILAAWEQSIERHPGVERLVMRERVAGPPGEDINVRLSGAEAEVLRSAADDLREVLSTFSGVRGVDDDLPYGQEQLLYSLNAEGRALGLSTDDLSRQIRDAFAGNLAQIYHQGRDEVEVRLRRPKTERDNLAALLDTQIRLPDGGLVPLESVVDLDSRRGFEVVRHFNGDLVVSITADVDDQMGNAGDIRRDLSANVLPQLEHDYGVESSFGGRADMQEETLGDMQSGLFLALGLIYLVLAWVFASYGWPLLVMAVIPFGIVGALAGHWLMGIDLTLLSLFGVFGLTGITVNNAIILTIFYRQIRASGVAVDEALVQASCQRLRAMILTSLTTIGGLLPLLAETSVQAQFLIPMAVAIAFGLAGATAIVLFLMPALLSIYEGAAERIAQGRGRARIME